MRVCFAEIGGRDVDDGGATDVGADERRGGGAIQQARVEMRQAEMLGEPAGQRSFPRRRRAVYRHNQRTLIG